MLMALLAAALLVWPATKPITRLREQRPRRLVVPQPLLLLAAAVAAWYIGGFGALFAALTLSLTVAKVRKTQAAQRNRLTATEALTIGLTGLVDELRAGAHPATAAANAAADSGPPTKEVLNAIAATARLGGDVDRTLRDLNQPQLTTALNQLARAWHVSTRHGVALAEVLDAARKDLTQRTAFARAVQAKLAGPKASAAVLAALPALGLLLGQLSGADPLTVLLTTVPGQLLLTLGAVLTSAGLLWTTNLTNQEVLP